MASPEDPAGDASHAVVLRAPDPRGLKDPILVLHARGVPYSVLRDADGGHLLAVPVEVAARARQELSDYVRESRELAGRKRPLPAALTDGLAGALAYAAALVALQLLQATGAGGLEWWGAGRIDSEAVRAGEVWRVLTALTLHVDLVHLFSNVFFGMVFGVLLAQTTGTGVAWLAVVVAGGLGNLVNVFGRFGEHLAVGASTAVFAALGLIAGHEMLRRRREGERRLRRLAPLVGGAVLLAWFGGGEAPTDVGAHVYGFAAGLWIGAVVERVGRRVDLRDARLQAACAVAAAALPALAWVAALA